MRITLDKKQGVTLISLVVTIIALLVISGVSITILTGENGVIETAMDAKEATELAQVKEEVTEKWYILENETAKEYYDNSKMADLFEEKLKLKDAKATAEYIEANETFEIFYKDYTLEMTDDGQVTNDRSSIADIIKAIWNTIKNDDSYTTIEDRLEELARELGVPIESVKATGDDVIVDEYNGYKVTISEDVSGDTAVKLEALEIERAKVIITLQPEDAKIIAGTSHTFTVEATTTGTVSYQWYKNITNTTVGGKAIRGATSNTFTISDAQTDDTQYYYCEVTDKYDGKTAKSKSNVAYLRVIKQITDEDISVARTQVVELGSELSLTATLDSADDAITYKWYYNNSDSNQNGIEISGATTNTYTKTTADNSDEKYYYCIATQTLESQIYTATSNTIRVYVKKSLSIATQPASVETNTGGSAELSVVANGSDTITYQWFKTNSSDDTEGAPIEGATSSTYSVENVTYLNDGYYYCAVRQIYEPDNTNIVLKTELVQIKVNRSIPTVTLSSTSGEVDFDSTQSFTATPSVEPAINGTWTVTSSNSDFVTIEQGNNETATINQPTTIFYRGIAATENSITITVVFVPEDRMNYNETSVVYTVNRVNKIDAQNPTTITEYSGTYDAQPHTVTVSDDYNGGDLQYSWDNAVWNDWTDSSKPELTNVTPSPVTVYVRVKGDSNHNDTTPISSTIYIGPKSISEEELQVTVTQDFYIFNGAEQMPSVTVIDTRTGETLTQNTDYVLEYPADVTNAGTKTITVKGNGNYSASTSKTVEYEIRKKSISGEDISITLSENTLVYNRTAQRPATIEVRDTTRNTLLVENTDYTLSYSDDITNVGTKTITVIGKGNYSESTSKIATYEITPKDVNTLTIILSQNTYVYDGTAKNPTVTVKDGETVLENNAEYTYEITNNIDVGTAIVTVTGKGNYDSTKTKTATFSITARDSSNFTIELGQSTYTYDGTAKNPSVVVKDGTKVLTNETDYTYEITDNINAGTAMVTVRGAGNYSDTIKTANFTINKIAITATAGSTTKQYDGTALTNSTVTITRGALATGQTFTGTASGTITNAGTAENQVNIAVVKDSNNNDVTSNYEITKQSGTLVITKVTPTVTLSSVSGTVDYSGTQTFTATPDAIPAIPGTWSVVSSNPTYVTIASGHNESATNATPTAITYNGAKATQNATAITVTYIPEDETNYERVQATYTVTAVNKINSTNPTTVTEYSGTYNGQPHTIEVSNDCTGGTLKYSTDNGTTWTQNKPTRTEVGTTTIQIYVDGDDNHNDSVILQSRIYIGTATMTITSNNYEGIYDGNAHWINVQVSEPSSGATVYYSTEKVLYQDNFQDGSQINPTFTNVGEWTVYWYVDPGTNTNYAGRSGSNKVTINKKSINTDIRVTLSSTTFTYNGASQRPNVSIVDLSRGSLTENVDYILTFPEDTTNTGTKTITITGIGNYSSDTTNSATYTITKKSISGSDIVVTLSETSFVYNKNAQTPGQIIVQDTTRGVTLTQGTDYTVAMPTEATNAGTKTITINGAGNYSAGTQKTATYTITPKDANTLTITLSANTFVYDGTAKEPTVTVQDAGTTITNGTDYTVTYSDNTNVGTGAVTITGTNNYTGTKTANFSITERDATNFTVTLSKDTYTYDGTAKNPTVTVKDGNKTLINNTDYTYTITNNINAGSALVTVVGKGNYDVNSTKTVNFTINKVSITVTAGSATKEYDGTALTNNSVTVTSGAVVAGHTFTGTTNGTITEIGSVENQVVTAVVRDGSGNDVSANYLITKQSGTLVVTTASTAITYTSHQSMVNGNSRTITASVSPAINGVWSVEAGSAVNVTAGNGVTGTSTTITYTGVQAGTADISITFTPIDTNYTTSTVIFTQTITDANYQVGSTYYTTLATAYADGNVVAEGIKTLQNCNDSSSFTITNKAITLDLGTYTIIRTSGTITVGSNGTLTIISTDETNEVGDEENETSQHVESSGVLTCSATQAINVNGGRLNINSGNIIGTGNYAISLSTGTVNVGRQEDTLNEKNPMITGKTYGINKTNASGIWNYYNGQVRGTASASTYSANSCRTYESIRTNTTEQYIYDTARENNYYVTFFTLPANEPVLTEGMIPIKYSGNTWVICSTSDPDWYSYTAKDQKWANVMLSDGTYNSSTAEGTAVAQADLGSMFVWIPRYAYSIEKGYRVQNGSQPWDTNASGQNNIRIQYLVNTTNSDSTGTVYNTDYDESQYQNANMVTPMITHPAFTTQSKQLPGIWIAKFESSGTNSSGNAVGNYTNGGEAVEPTDGTTIVKSLPSKVSWRHITVGNMQYRCTSMASNTAYGWSSGTVNTHLIKNSEWGSVAYLCYSRYGTVPMINGCGTVSPRWYDLYTGMGPAGEKSEGRYDAIARTGHEYNTTNGQLASTTGNTYGIYDMSGGSWEYVAAFLNNKHSNLANGNSTDVTYFNRVNTTPVNEYELNPTYSSLWEKYDVSSEERNNTITVEGVNGTLRKDQLWNANGSSYTDMAVNIRYNTARKRLTDATYNLMQVHKGIGVNEVAGSHSFYGVGENGAYQWKTKVDDKATVYGRAWNNDYVLIGHAAIPFVIRGSGISDGAGAGVLYSIITSGGGNYYNGFRAALWS